MVGSMVFAFTLGGALIANWARTALPEHHLGEESRDTVKLAIGLIATMTALVLGLVTASAKSSFDAMDLAVKHTAVDVLTRDRLLARYGPETGQIRGALRNAVAGRIDAILREAASGLTDVDPMRSGTATGSESLADAIQLLTPHDDSQQSLKSRARDLAEEILQVRWLVFAGVGSSVPGPFITILVFWLTITFASFGLFAPRNGTVVMALFVCAVSVGSAVFLILELDGPFDGFIRVSVEPLRYAHANMNQ